MNDNSEKLVEETKNINLKKIRSVIAKYKNKSSDMSTLSIENHIMKTLNLPLNKSELKDKEKSQLDSEYNFLI
jgi:hypothetical protein